MAAKRKRAKKKQPPRTPRAKVPAALTAQQLLFIDEYMVDLNATQAAIRAGYSKRTAYAQGARLLKHVEIARRIDARMAARSAKLGITAERVVEELVHLGLADVRKAMKWTANGVTFIDSDQLDEGTARAIQSVKAKSRTIKGGENTPDETIVELELRFHGKAESLHLIGRHLGMWKDKMVHEHKLTLEQLAAEATKPASA